MSAVAEYCKQVSLLRKPNLPKHRDQLVVKILMNPSHLKYAKSQVSITCMIQHRSEPLSSNISTVGLFRRDFVSFDTAAALQSNTLIRKHDAPQNSIRKLSQLQTGGLYKCLRENWQHLSACL